MVDATSTNEAQTNGSASQMAHDVAAESKAKQEVKAEVKAEPNPLVLCGPSGTGKSTILKAVMVQSKYKDLLAFSVSHTTRKPRPGEAHGREYYFSDRESMLTDIAAGKFIESAEYSGNLYGTSKESVHQCKSQGKICVLDIDSQGVRSLKKVSNLSPVYVFVKPPSMASLEERLRSRKTETEESLKKRLDAAKEEIAFGEEEGVFDALIVNDDLDAAILQLTSIIDTKILAPLDSTPATTTPAATTNTTPAVSSSLSSSKEKGAGDEACIIGLPEVDNAGGKRAKLDAGGSSTSSSTESSRDSTPGVER